MKRLFGHHRSKVITSIASMGASFVLAVILAPAAAVAAPPNSTPGGGAYSGCSIPITPQSCGFVGAGTSEDPYQLSDCSLLMNSRFFLSNYFVMTEDIDCQGINVVPIGNSDVSFTGSFNGAGYTISNIEMTSSGDLGLFGNSGIATIDNLRLINSTFTLDPETGGNYSVGSLVGFANGTTITNVYIDEGVVVTSTNAGLPYTGGIVGGASGETVITSSRSSADVIGANKVGGIAGLLINSAVITDSYANGNIFGDVHVGGLVGQMEETSNIYTSYSSVTMTSDSYAGGLVGTTYDSAGIEDSFSVSDMSGVTGEGAIGGIVGDNAGSGLRVGLSFDQELAGRSNCKGTGDGTITCDAITDPDYFKGNGDNLPLDNWTADDPWNLHEAGKLPTFAVGQVSCDEPSAQTESTIVFRCAFQREMQHQYSGVEVSKQVRYRLDGESGEWTYQNWPTGMNKIVITGLSAATLYELQFHASWTVDASEWTTNRLTTSTEANPGPDLDNDGIKDSLEVSGPNYGDANQDDIDDNSQVTVASLKSPVSNGYTVLQTSGCGTPESDENSGIDVSAMSTDHKDPAYVYPSGLLGFTAQCSEAPALSTLSVTQYWYGDYPASQYVARKYNSVTHTYAQITDAVLTNVVVGGQSALKIEYQIADNGPYDQNAAVGIITDPIGPAAAAVTSPNTGIGSSRNLLQRIFK